MNWRFLSTLDTQVDIAFLRDLDSSISQREMDAVKQFLESSKVGIKSYAGLKIYIIETKNFQFGRVLFSRRETFLAKSDLASTILLIPWYCGIFFLILGRNY